MREGDWRGVSQVRVPQTPPPPPPPPPARPGRRGRQPRSESRRETSQVARLVCLQKWETRLTGSHFSRRERELAAELVAERPLRLPGSV